MANDGILHPFNITGLAFIWERRGTHRQPLLGVGRDRVWRCQDSSLIVLLSL